MDTEVDILIIGGGIVGLMCAYKLKKNRPKLEVVLIEKEQYLGDHSTGRSSCVLHSGLYYTTNSLKHIHCIEGHRQWLALSKELDIPINLCGKYIITNKVNDSELDKLYQQAIANNVKDIHYVDSKKIALLKQDLYNKHFLVILFLVYLFQKKFQQHVYLNEYHHHIYLHLLKYHNLSN